MSNADAIAARFIAYLETNELQPGLFAPDMFCDFTLPTWRLQARGEQEAHQLRLRGHGSPGKIIRHRVDATAGGFVLEVEEQWDADGDRWYCRELFRVDTRGDAITDLAVYCTGDWSSARRAEHARSVTLLRP